MELTSFIPATVLLAAGFSASASVQINTTRVIYNAADKDVSVQVTNPGNFPVLLQSWIDAGNPDVKPESISIPFVLTPPLSRVNQNSGQTLRIALIDKSALNLNKESVYWLNVLEIPPLNKKDTNQIQVAFRTRIKLFYRPAGLNAKAAGKAASDLSWKQVNSNITLINNSPYFVSASELKVNSEGKNYSIPAEMIEPESQKSFSLPADMHLKNSDKVSVFSINDYGAESAHVIAHQ